MREQFAITEILERVGGLREPSDDPDVPEATSSRVRTQPTTQEWQRVEEELSLDVLRKELREMRSMPEDGSR